MCYSSFYAQVIGLYFFLLNLTMLLHGARWKRQVSELLSNHALLAVTGAVGMLIGLILVTTHNVWVSDWHVVITLVGWFVLLQSLMRLFYPEAFVNMVKGMSEKGKGTICNWIFLLVGIYLIWAGFFRV